MKYILTISLILLSLCNSYNKITAAESTSRYHALYTSIVIPKNEIDKYKPVFFRQNSVYMPNIILTPIGKNTFAVDNAIPFRPFSLRLKPIHHLPFLKNPGHNIILADDGRNFYQKFYIDPERIYITKRMKKRIIREQMREGVH